MRLSRALLRTTPIAAMALVPVLCSARTIAIGLGAKYDFGGIFTVIAPSIITFLGTSIFWISLTMFVVGTLLFILSAGNEGLLTRGKGLMIGALIGMAVVLGAYALYRTVVWVLYFA